MQSCSKQSSQIGCLRLPVNSGKAEAVRAGVLQSLGHAYVGYWDADLATPLGEADSFLGILESQASITAVYGCRLQRLGASIDRSVIRHYFGRVAATLISLLLRLPCYDTQCGAKLFRAEEAGQLFKEPFSSRWLFDVELLARLIQRLGRHETSRRVVECPIYTWSDKEGSKVHFKEVLKLPRDLLLLAKRYQLPPP